MERVEFHQSRLSLSYLLLLGGFYGIFAFAFGEIFKSPPAPMLIYMGACALFLASIAYLYKYRLAGEPFIAIDEQGIVFLAEGSKVLPWSLVSHAAIEKFIDWRTVHVCIYLSAGTVFDGMNPVRLQAAGFETPEKFVEHVNLRAKANG